ncbi:hypothetical protein EC75_22335, partial [Escherichia coli 75]
FSVLSTPALSAVFGNKITWLISPNSDKYKQILLKIKNSNR